MNIQYFAAPINSKPGTTSRQWPPTGSNTLRPLARGQRLPGSSQHWALPDLQLHSVGKSVAKGEKRSAPSVRNSEVAPEKRTVTVKRPAKSVTSSNTWPFCERGKKTFCLNQLHHLHFNIWLTFFSYITSSYQAVLNSKADWDAPSLIVLERNIHRGLWLLWPAAIINFYHHFIQISTLSLFLNIYSAKSKSKPFQLCLIRPSVQNMSQL